MQSYRCTNAHFSYSFANLHLESNKNKQFRQNYVQLMLNPSGFEKGTLFQQVMQNQAYWTSY